MQGLEKLGTSIFWEDAVRHLETQLFQCAQLCPLHPEVALRASSAAAQGLPGLIGPLGLESGRVSGAGSPKSASLPFLGEGAGTEGRAMPAQ